MNIYGVSRTGVSGTNAPSTKPGTVADKAASTEFSELILESNANGYNSGAVATSVRRAISTQGSLEYPKSPTNLGIEGGGTVSDPKGRPFLIRTGSFVTEAATGDLVDGTEPMPLGRPLDAGNPTAILNGIDDKTLQGEPPTSDEPMPLGRPLGDGNPTAILKGTRDKTLKGVPPTSGEPMPLGRPFDDGNPTAILNGMG